MCKTPQIVAKFFTNNENKTRLIPLTFNYIKENSIQCLNILKCGYITLSGDGYCEAVTPTGCEVCDNLQSNQEEADTKVVLHPLKVLSMSSENVCIRSTSGDTDIFVIALGLIEEKSRVKFDYGNGENQKEIWLNEINLPADQLQALIGAHAFTGNDYVPALFRKGKIHCWKTMLKENNFVEMFQQLGEQWELDDVLKTNLERYVCYMYGSKKESVNVTRFELFERKQKKGIIIDLSNIPPCHSTLVFQMERANYVAKLWKMAGIPMLNAPFPVGYGWGEDGDIQWIEQILPEDISILFIQNKDSDNDSDEESDDNDDFFGGEEESETEIDSDFEY